MFYLRYCSTSALRPIYIYLELYYFVTKTVYCCTVKVIFIVVSTVCLTFTVHYFGVSMDREVQYYRPIYLNCAIVLVTDPQQCRLSYTQLHGLHTIIEA